MSENNEKLVEVSEDLFTTQDLIENEAVINKNQEVSDVFTEISEEITEENDGERIDDLAEDDENELGDEGDEPAMEAVETNEIPVEGAEVKKVARKDRITELPLARVKHIIKLDPEVNLVNAEAVFLITKAAESFIRSLAKESFGFAAQQKKKTITKAHVDQALQMLPVEL